MFSSDTAAHPGRGNMLMGARHYAPCIGQVISRDPIGFAGGINLYPCSGGDPINWADPSGLDFLGIPTGTWVGAGVAGLTFFLTGGNPVAALVARTLARGAYSR